MKKFTFSLIFTMTMSACTLSSAIAKENSFVVLSPMHFDVSIPLKDVTETVNNENHLNVVDHELRPFKFIKRIPDGALQTSAEKNALIPLFQFKGIGVGLRNYNVDWAPADANGSVGLTQYVQGVNADIGVFDKGSGLILPGFPKPGNAIWRGFGGPCEAYNKGQLIVKYDQLANRWVISQPAYKDINTGPFAQCIAVSKTADATGAYNRYAYEFKYISDDPKLGLWPDAYYMSFNVSYGPRICAVDRTSMLAGKPANMVCFSLTNTDYGILLPADLDGMQKPAQGTPGYFMGLKPSNMLRLFKFHVDFAQTNNSRITGPIDITVANYTPACYTMAGRKCAVQPNTTNRLDTLSDRLMHRLAYRQFGDHGSMVATHTVEGPEPKISPALRWYELRFNNGSTNPVVYQQSTRSPDSKNRFIGSIAMDKFGNIALGYTVTSSLIYPSIELSWRNSGDPLNTMDYLQPLVTGLGSQINGLNRWGDYNSMSIDPLDDCTFWYTNQYLQKSGSFNWSTKVVRFKLEGCAG